MNYKIVSNNKKLLEKAHHIFNILGMKEAIHTQDVNLWIIDVKSMDNQAITSYKNRKNHTFLLFIVNDNNDIKICLENEFTNYINIEFSTDELLYWIKFFQKRKKKKTIKFKENFYFDLDENILIQNNKKIDLTKKELLLIKELLNDQFVQTQTLMISLSLSSKTSIRTIVNRIRKKTTNNFLVQKRGFGYKLNIEKKPQKPQELDLYLKELEEQNHLMQHIIDSSPIFIVTFIHKQLYCINESFRQYLGKKIIKELWDETEGDFFQLIKHNSFEYEKLKKALLSKGKNIIELLNFKGEINNKFEVETFYFENLDKHLLVFKKS